MIDLANGISASRWVRLAAALLVMAQGLSLAAADAPRPNLTTNIEHALRYRAEGADFVIDNGGERFNRPLYGGNTAFRVDGGDLPEFVLYLPGRGGNLRFGLRTAGAARWLDEAAHITTRYRPGELLYEIRDPLLGEQGVLRLEVLALHQTEGLIVRAVANHIDALTGIELVAAYGGVNGARGARDGDIGTESIPISRWFQLQPEFAQHNAIARVGGGFELVSPVAHIAGVMPGDANVATGDARAWEHLDSLLTSTTGDLPVALVRFKMRSGVARYLGLQRLPGGSAAATELGTYQQVSATAPTPAPGATSGLASRYRYADLPRVFAAARVHFAAVRNQIRVQTPDPIIDAAVGALNAAADAVWDEPQHDIMHGAIAWRARLLGWRGPYALDALGWHERSAQHLRYWAKRQNTDPVPPAIPPPEAATNLSRNPQALHSNGDLSNTHYDMNLVYIDALFRHLLWTGDLRLARELWPVIERHLAWERRLFRREFGPERLPLYEAYASIWASDDLGYNGGGVAYSSAYNWWHNQMAARLAQLLGHDAAPYAHEAALIRRAMSEYLWQPDEGMFAEYRDYLGLQLAHPSAGLWSFYHLLDAPGLVSTRDAWQMSRYVDRALPHLPVRGPGIASNGDFVLATSHWLPYTWSVNNVVMGENVHAALGYWQVGRGDDAFHLLRSALLASMYMGICPGNVGSMNYLDVYRRESQRDFADGAGVTARAIVEGLFGIHPDALAGKLEIQPGWPSDWPRAVLHAPEIDLQYRSDGDTASYTLASRLPGVHSVRLRIPVVREQVTRITVNGLDRPARTSSDAVGRRWLDIDWALQSRNVVLVTWGGKNTRSSQAQMDAAAGLPPLQLDTDTGGQGTVPLAANAEFSTVAMGVYFNDQVTKIFAPGKYLSPRSPFASLALPSQGIGAWAGHVNANATIDDSGLRRVAAQHAGKFVLPSGVPFDTPVAPNTPNILFTSQWDNYPHRASVPLQGHAQRLFLLMAGSTSHMQSQFDNGEVVVSYADGSSARLALRNPSNWWPIDQDYFIDDYQFRRPEAIPPRVNLQTGEVRMLSVDDFKGRGGMVPGGAATVLELPLDASKELRSLTVGALANEVVIGLMAATLLR